MIEINLVPTQLRRKRRSKAEKAAGIPKETVLGLTALGIVFLVISAILLQGLITMKLTASKRLKKELDEILPQKINGERYVTQIQEAKAKLAPLEKLLAGRDIQWSRKLNEISDKLPRGVWLTRITLEEDFLLVSGSAVSKSQVEMINVHNFNTNLKESRVFMQDFKDIELEMIKTRSVNETTIADFTIKINLN